MECETISKRTGTTNALYIKNLGFRTYCFMKFSSTFKEYSLPNGIGHPVVEYRQISYLIMRVLDKSKSLLHFMDYTLGSSSLPKEYLLELETFTSVM